MADDRWYMGLKLTPEQWKDLQSDQKIEYAGFLHEKFHGNMSQASLWIGLNRTSLQLWFRRYLDSVGSPEHKPVERSRGDLTTLVFESGEEVSKESILQRLGMTPREFDVTNISVTEWEAQPGDGADPIAMLRVNCKVEPRDVFLFEFLEELWQNREGQFEFTPGSADVAPGLWQVWGADPHFPLDEPMLIEGLLAFIEDHRDKIGAVNILGDGMDNSKHTRHRPNKRTDRPVKETVHRYRAFLRGISERVPDDCKRRVIRGNHCSWILQRLAEKNPEILDIPFGETDEQFFTLDRILQLEDIGWEFTQPMGGLGEYFDDHIVTQEYDDLMAHHGVATGKYGGAIKELESGFEGSWIQGHAHTMAMIARIVRTPKAGEFLRLAMDVPALSRRDLGYSHRKNVAQGFLVTSDHGNGRWHPEYGIWWPQDNRLTFRDWSYSG